MEIYFLSLSWQQVRRRMDPHLRGDDRLNDKILNLPAGRQVKIFQIQFKFLILNLQLNNLILFYSN